MDLVIRNAMIIDGTGSPARAGDVGVKDGRIAAVGTVTARGREEIDAAGLALTPGFIDTHTHYDAQAFWDPMLSPSVYHGVTTVLAGNCGFTLAPLSGDPEDTDYLLRMLSRVEGMPLSTLRAAVKPTWKSFGEYLDCLDGRLAINTVFLVGHSALRRAVMGERSVTDKASAEDLDAMRALLRRSLAEGGAGFSTTIANTHSDYEGRPVPSRVASREEILALAEVCSEFPGTWCEIVFAVPRMNEEQWSLATEMSLRAQRSVNWNAVILTAGDASVLESKLHAGDYARERGATVWALVPTVPLASWLNFANMFVLDTIPNWIDLVAMSREQKIAALADPAFRARLKEGAAQEARSAVPRFPNWHKATIGGLVLPHNLQWNGGSLGDCAAARGQEPLDTLFDLAVEENLSVSFLQPAERTDDESWTIRRDLWRDGRCMIGGSDAGAHLDMLNAFAFSTQLLGEGVRRRKLLPLEEAVHRITAVPAQRFGLSGRGRIEVGAVADLVVLDPDTVDCGPIALRNDLPQDEPRLYAEAVGIRHVIVGGVPVAGENKGTGRMAGRVLRSGRDTATVPIGA